MRILQAIGAMLSACAAIQLNKVNMDIKIIEVPQTSVAQLNHKAMKQVKLGNMHAALQMDANRKLIQRARFMLQQAARAAKKAEEAEPAVETAEESAKAEGGVKESGTNEPAAPAAAGNATAPAAGAANATGAAPADAGNATAGNETADEVAAAADKAKATQLRSYAKQHLDGVLSAYKELDTHLKEKFEALEKVLMDTEINVTGFDPDSEEDIKWLTGEMEKILEAAPEIKHLEEKLKMVKTFDSSLDSVISDLEKITDIAKMVVPKEEVASASPVNANGTTNATAGANGTAPAGNSTKANVTAASPSATKNATANATAGAAGANATSPAPAAAADKNAGAAAAKPADAKAAVQVNAQKAKARATISSHLKQAVSKIFSEKKPAAAQQSQNKQIANTHKK